MNVLKKSAASLKTGVGSSKIQYLVKQGRFPKPINLGECNKSVGWVESELDAWIQEQIDRRDGVVETEDLS